jgi:AcrR family transcriptional regulator
VPEARPGQAGGPRDRQRRARTTEIATAALRLFLSRGIEPVTVDDIASGAHIAKGSFYTYFKDKDDLVAALIEPVAARLGEAFDRCEVALGAAEDALSMTVAYSTLALECGTVVMENASIARLYLQESRGPSVGARVPIVALSHAVHTRAVALTLVARTRGLLKPIDPVVSADVVVGAVEALLMRVLSEGAPNDPSALTGALIELVLHGVAAQR